MSKSQTFTLKHRQRKPLRNLNLRRDLLLPGNLILLQFLNIPTGLGKTQAFHSGGFNTEKFQTPGRSYRWMQFSSYSLTLFSREVQPISTRWKSSHEKITFPIIARFCGLGMGNSHIPAQRRSYENYENQTCHMIALLE